MKTQIFDSYESFCQREDKDVNGVSQVFANHNPDYHEDNKTNKGCWNCRYCRDCRYCSDCRSCSSCSYCRYCSYCSSCSYCSYCRYCRDCRYCSDCSDCSDCRSCSSCSYCRYCRGNNVKDINKLHIPKIEKIHTKVYEIVTKTNHSLNMDEWHTCDTTHCRAGWVIVLAGEEGKELEKKTSTEFAAKAIYNKSSPIKVSPNEFYLDNELSMSKIKEAMSQEQNQK